MESGVSENAVSGHIQLIVPGKTACFAVMIVTHSLFKESNQTNHFSVLHHWSWRVISMKALWNVKVSVLQVYQPRWVSSLDFSSRILWSEFIVLMKRCEHPEHLRYLLNFGRVSNYLGYNALDDHFLVRITHALFALEFRPFRVSLWNRTMTVMIPSVARDN